MSSFPGPLRSMSRSTSNRVEPLTRYSESTSIVWKPEDMSPRSAHQSSLDCATSRAGPAQAASPRGAPGSGIVIDSRGYFLTNDHLVGRADQIWVTLPDGRQFEAMVEEMSGARGIPMEDARRMTRRLIQNPEQALDTLDSLTERVHAVEHRLLPAAVAEALRTLRTESTPAEVS